jgi:circadian clock protein KaiB
MSGPETAGEFYRLRLYVAGQTPKSLIAVGNLRRLCEQHLQRRYEIEVVDLLQNPQLAKGVRSSPSRRWSGACRHRW